MPSKTTEATMYITLRSYLNTLKEREKSKPPQERLHVPNFTELAEEVGVTKAAISYIASGSLNQLNLELGAKIIWAMRKRGFQMEITDLLAFRPPLSSSADE